LKEKLKVHPLGVRQSLGLRLDNIDYLLRSNGQNVLADFLHRVDLAFHNQIVFEPGGKLRPVTSNLAVGGVFNAEIGMELSADEEIALALRVRADDFDLFVRDKLEFKGFGADFDFAKSYRLGVDEAEQLAERESPLSMEVLSAGLLEAQASGGGAISVERLRRDAKQAMPGFSLKSLRLLGDAPRIELSDYAMGLKFVDSLPIIDKLQMNLLGGTVLCSFRLFEKGSQYRMGLEVGFSGIDAERMMPEILEEMPGRETEISGRLQMRTPMSTDPDKLLEDLAVHLHVTHIGRRLLGRILYALDPFESNEAVVQQRKMVELGSPRWIQIDIENGNLSLKGVVAIKGVDIALPRLERVNVAGLPIETQLRKALVRLTSLQKKLDFLRADALVVEQGNQIRPVYIKKQ